MLIEKYYIYRHIRPDTGVPFYIGRGKVSQRGEPFRRAFSVKKRNNLWRGIVERNGGEFEVEIMYAAETPEEINRKEVEFIALYGRIIDKNNGTLTNLTFGGEGAAGYEHSPESCQKMSEIRRNDKRMMELLNSPAFKAIRLEKLKGRLDTMKGRRHSAATLELFRTTRKGANHPEAKKVLDTSTGIVYGCVEDAANATKWTRSTLHTYLKPSCKRNNPTPLRYV